MGTKRAKTRDISAEALLELSEYLDQLGEEFSVNERRAILRVIAELKYRHTLEVQVLLLEQIKASRRAGRNAFILSILALILILVSTWLR